MAFNFPLSPTNGDTYLYGGLTYQYDGTRWLPLRKPYSYNGVELTSANNQVNLDLNTGNLFEWNSIEDTTITFINPPVGDAINFKIKIAAPQSSYSVFDLGVASYDNVSLSISAQDASPLSICLNTTGTKLYMLGGVNKTVYQYTLSTAFDLSTASYDSVSLSVSAQSANPQSIILSSTGTTIFLVGGTTSNIYKYTMSTAFNLSTAVYSSSKAITEDTALRGLSFSNNALKMFVVGSANKKVYQYTLPTAYALSSAVYDNISFDISGEDTYPYAISFNTSGTAMFINGAGNDKVYQYNVSTAFDISTASYSGINYYVGNEDTDPFGLTFSASGNKMYIAGSLNDSIYQYSTGNTPLHTTSWGSNILWETISAPAMPDLNQTNLLSFYTSDGGTTYYGKSVGDNIS